MKLFSSLFAKIVCWFFLNLALVAVVLAVFFAFQLRMDFGAAFGRRMADGMRVAERLISLDLNQTSREKWPEVLTRHSEIHQVEFGLVLEDGTAFFSHDLRISEADLRKVTGEFPPPPPPIGFPGPPVRDGRPPRPFEMPDDHPPGLRELGPRIDENRPPGGPGDGHPGRPRLMVRTENPTRYWIRTFMPLYSVHNRPGHRSFAQLVAVSDSITGNGFFFDPSPWIVTAVAVLFLSVLWWIPLAGHITRPITRLTRAAEEIARGRFSIRIEENRRDEIGRLGNAINHMTGRLSGFINGQKRFLGDVAHELGSPVARIQLGLGILEQRVDPENRSRVADVMEDVDQMADLVTELLSFSKAEMDRPVSVALTSISLSPLIGEVVAREGSPEVDIMVRIAADIRVTASRELLARALSNLVRNAVRYAGDAGTIVITAEEKNARVVIEVKDSGPGVPEDLREAIFEPFYRLEPSRGRDSGGVGLGLAIVKTCIQACNGTVVARNNLPRGLAVTISIEAGTK